MTYAQSYPVRKSRCPKCAEHGRDRTGDNLIEYSDGHLYCFSCGYLVTGSGHNLVRNLPRPEKPLALPEDAETTIPKAPKEWLEQYDLTQTEITHNTILWSDFRKLLIFPYFGEKDDLLGWQGRYFGSESKHPKWFSRGDLKQIYHILGKGDSIICVEDIVSAIKVSRYTRSIPLFGSHIPLERFIKLSKLGKSVGIWLDPDKRTEAVKYASIGKSIGLDTFVIFSDKDPKEHTKEEILFHLTRNTMCDTL